MDAQKVLEQVKKDNIKFITLQFTDLLGVIKEVIMPVEELQDALTDGVWFDGSSIEGFARIQESDLFGSIQRERDIRDWKFRPSVGVKISLPLEPFVKARFTKIYPMQDWAVRGDQNFYWFDDSGFGSDSTVDFDRPVGQEHLFRASSFARWTEESEYFQRFFRRENRRISQRKVRYGMA